jgi:toxin CcdB
VQSDLLEDLGSRVVPLRRVDRFATTYFPPDLAPIFEIKDTRCFMETPKLAAVPLKILKTPLVSLAEFHASITCALDFLFQGF